MAKVKVCLNCKQEYTPHPKATNRQKWCSKTCSYRSKRQILIKRRVLWENKTTLICKRCEKEKILTDFYKASFKNPIRTHRNICKDCANERISMRTFEKKEWIRKYKEQNFCMDCNKFYPYYVMDFDHRDKQQKLNNISHMHANSIDEIKEEIAKCDLVCSNCHRIRTHLRGDLVPLDKIRRV